MWLTIAVAFQIAVMRESDARGPFCSTVMAVVVVKDVLLFVCLAMNLEFANMVRRSYERHSVSPCMHIHHTVLPCLRPGSRRVGGLAAQLCKMVVLRSVLVIQ